MFQDERRVMLALLLSLLIGVACANPVGVRVANPREIHRYLTRSALTSEEASGFTQNELRRYDLLAAYEDDPLAAIADLHAAARDENFPSDALFALAELSFLLGERNRAQDQFAASMIYAWAFLYPEDGRAPLDPLNPRVRIAADLYNRAMTSTFKRRKSGGLIQLDRRAIESGEIRAPLHFGEIRVAARPDLLEADGVEYYDLRPVTELAVTGVRNRYRVPGIGSPLAARARPLSDVEPVVTLDEDSLVPLTAIVAIDDPIAGLHAGQLRGRLMIFASLDVHTIDHADHTIALESEPTAALAASLAESQFWKREMQNFLGNAIGLRRDSALDGVRPYRKGRIPVVFVHGTASSPARWADMINDLMADVRLQDRYAFWTFRYDSGNPIAYSALQLRTTLSAAVERADPDGRDPCVQDMVVLGHSQGGLLTKLTAIDSGDRFWARISDQDFEEIKMRKRQKDLLRGALFVKRLPFVTEVIFLATPHRGSYLAGPQIVRRLAERLVRLPSDLVRLGADLVTVLPQGGVGLTASRVPTSIDNMSPSNPFIETLAEIPVVPEVKAHSIIAVGKGSRPLESASDGVVKYPSAHIEGVESELLVKSPHSGMQAAPQTIEEVRRILLGHSEASGCPLPDRP